MSTVISTRSVLYSMHDFTKVFITTAGTEGEVPELDRDTYTLLSCDKTTYIYGRIKNSDLFNYRDKSQDSDKPNKNIGQNDGVNLNDALSSLNLFSIYGMNQTEIENRRFQQIRLNKSNWEYFTFLANQYRDHIWGIVDDKCYFIPREINDQKVKEVIQVPDIKINFNLSYNSTIFPEQKEEYTNFAIGDNIFPILRYAKTGANIDSLISINQHMIYDDNPRVTVTFSSDAEDYELGEIIRIFTKPISNFNLRVWKIMKTMNNDGRIIERVEARGW